MMLQKVAMNGFYFGAGLTFLGLACAKQRLRGYTTPTDFASDDWPSSMEHVRSIVSDIRKFPAMQGWDVDLHGRSVLELGPGATLGTGVLLAGLGIAHYQAIDVFPLARATPAKFYTSLAESELDEGVDREKVRAAARAMQNGPGGTIAYAVDRGLDIPRMVQGKKFDLIVSNAAFEHVEDIDATIAKLTEVAAPGAIFLAMIDFQTHSRWVRSRDPNSIYRIPGPIYRALAYDGQPNRKRPRDYVRALERAGWSDCGVRGVHIAPDDYLAWSTSGLSAPYRTVDSDMAILTGAVLAKRSLQ